MKFISFIMAFLVLALSVMPCADDEPSEKDNHANAKIEAFNHQQQDEQQDDCSPFCNCACCAGFSINHFIAVLSYATHYTSEPASSFLHIDSKGIDSPIWQPPQLV